MKVRSTDEKQSIHLDFNLEEVNWTDEQKDIVKKLFSNSKFEELSKKEKDLIKDLKITIGSSKPIELAGIVSFNWNWFSIDPQ